MPAMLGRVDSQYIGPPYAPTLDEQNYDARYQGGYWNKPGRSLYSYNFKFIRRNDKGPVTVLRLPKDWKAQVAALSKFDLNPDSSDDENGRWYMAQGYLFSPPLPLEEFAVLLQPRRLAAVEVVPRRDGAERQAAIR